MIQNPKLLWVNVVLGLLVIVFLGAHLYVSNSFISKKVSLASKKKELNVLSAEISKQESTMSRSQDLSTLVLLAERSGMVLSNHNDTLLVSSNVALSNAKGLKKQQ